MSKMMKDWVYDRLELLTEHSDELVEIGPDNVDDNQYRPMTALKEMSLSYCISFFSNIVNDNYPHTHYMDFCAGGGITGIRGKDIHITGSAILAPVMAKKPFKEYHFFEADKNRADALEERLLYLDKETSLDVDYENCKVYHGDANKRISDVIDYIKNDAGGVKGVNLFSFIDNEGPDIEWSTVKDIAQFHGDMLINYPSTGLSRRSGKFESATDDEITAFLGTEEWKPLRKRKGRIENQLRNIYTSNLKEEGKRCRSIRVDSGRSGSRYYYDLIYTTRDIDGGNGYLRAVKTLKENIESLDGDDVDVVLDQMHGKQSSFDLLPDEGTIDEEGKDEEDTIQTDVRSY